ncbi:hypothetical protein DE146DRAFT_107914 [Phaeosphaeria sp. MPI-PUGE-AT-0046c]|nr:hypothetical protein DE146DRAFT_107914 [Phaeosphaeria sp. MPI-PUGE-AT-0046c]
MLPLLATTTRCLFFCIIVTKVGLRVPRPRTSCSALSQPRPAIVIAELEAGGRATSRFNHTHNDTTHTYTAQLPFARSLPPLRIASVLLSKCCVRPAITCDFQTSFACARLLPPPCIPRLCHLELDSTATIARYKRFTQR